MRVGVGAGARVGARMRVRAGRLHRFGHVLVGMREEAPDRRGRLARVPAAAWLGLGFGLGLGLDLGLGLGIGVRVRAAAAAAAVVRSAASVKVNIGDDVRLAGVVPC